MKKYLFAVALAALAMNATVQAADWFPNLGTPTFGKVEYDTNGRIWISIPWSNPGVAVQVNGLSTSCTITQVQLIAPTGKEREWLAMILAATAGGKTFSVYADCNPGAYRLDATRLTVEF